MVPNSELHAAAVGAVARVVLGLLPLGGARWVDAKLLGHLGLE